MKRLKMMKEHLMACAESQMGNLAEVDAEELGEVIDMIKDLEEAMYYHSIREAMDEKEEKKEEHYHYYTPYYSPERDMDKDYGRMYYSGQPRDSKGRFMEDGRATAYYTEREYPVDMRDKREGRSPMQRRMYMESKELHKDKNVKMKELEKYVQELGEDLVEMIEDASPEEKQMLSKKIASLAEKING